MFEEHELFGVLVKEAWLFIEHDRFDDDVKGVVVGGCDLFSVWDKWYVGVEMIEL